VIDDAHIPGFSIAVLHTATGLLAPAALVGLLWTTATVDTGALAAPAAATAHLRLSRMPSSAAVTLPD
jgi:hypothetical protein